MSIRALVSGSVGVLASASAFAGEGCPGLVFGDESLFIEVPSELGMLPHSVGVADLTGDGVTDLLLGSGSLTTAPPFVALIRGEGGMAFGELELIPVSVVPQMLRLTDLDGDGDEDVVINGNAGVCVLQNDGTGVLDEVFLHEYPFETSYGDLHILDVNGDGIRDIVTIGAYLEGIDVFLGDNAGGFRPPVFSPVFTQSVGVDTGDFNGDGVVDLAIAQYTNPGGVAITLGNGDGTFSVSYTRPSPHGTVAVRTADLDGDGAVDFVVGHQNRPYIEVSYGDGNGGVEETIQFESGQGGWSFPQSLALDDLDGDGYRDIIVAAGYEGPTVLMGREGRSFLSVREYGAAGSVGIASVQAVDVNLDGLRDIVASDAIFGVGVHIVINACDDMCSGADLARPHGDQDLGDITLFVDLFSNGNPIADLNRDNSLDLADIISFVSQFGDDCPGGDD